MTTEANGDQWTYADSSRYKLPNDAQEHDRLNAQAAGLVKLMNDQPFHAPLSKPTKILDIGCGTGYTTNMLGAQYLEAKVIGVDLSAVPDSGLKQPSNVKFVQGDIRDLIESSPDFQPASFDYIFQRFLIYGITDWPGHIEFVAKLLKPGGWLEFHEPDMQLTSRNGERLADTMEWYRKFKEDIAVTGLEPELGTKLPGLVRASPSLENVQSKKYGLSPVPSEDKPELRALSTQLPHLFNMIATKVSGARRSQEELDGIVRDMYASMDRKFNEGDHFPVFAVYGQKKVE